MKKIIRIIPKLDIKNGNLIKGVNLEGLRVLGDPILFAQNYYNQGADEIVYVDNVATLYGTNNLTKFVKKTSKKIFIPLTVGGGIKTLDNIEQMLKNGADKISINSAAIDNLKIIKNASKVFGRSTIVSNIECVKIKNKYYISKSNGRDLIKIDPVIWAKKLEDNGIGEIFLTSVNKEGLKSGFDINIIEKISSKLNIPVIAHGGAGNFEHIKKLIKNTNIDGVAISSLLHYSTAPYFIKNFNNTGNTHFLETLKKETKKINVIKNLKNFLKKNKINVRV